MSQPMTSAQWLAALRAEGITRIVEMPGWETHNRNHKGPWGEVHGLAIHHTVGVGKHMAQQCYDGRPDLPGPLCHDFLATDGTLYLVGNGRTNHAGTIAANSRTAIIEETLPMGAAFKPDADEPYDGNRMLYGLEIENKGDGKDPYPDAQYDVAVRWAAARCRFHGWSARSVAGHREVTRRKIDPSFFMSEFRMRVAARLTAPADGGNAMSDLTAKGVWSYKNTEQGETSDVYAYVRNTKAVVDDVKDITNRTGGQVVEQRVILTALMALLKSVDGKLDRLLAEDGESS
jgi:hypothetical protein